MKFSDLYKIKGFPVVTVTLTVISFVMSCTVWLVPTLFDYLCIETRPQYFWQYFSGCFIHNIEPKWVMWVHMIMNFMGLVPFGIIVEKVLGSKKTFLIFLAELVVTAVSLQLASFNNPTKISGISTITYVFATVAFYCIFLVLKKKETSCFKQPLFYYFIFQFWGMLQMLIMMNPVNALTSFVGHISGIVVGIVTVLFAAKEIKEKICVKGNKWKDESIQK